MVDCAAQEHDVALADTADIINNETTDTFNEETAGIINEDTTDIINEDTAEDNEDKGDTINEDLIRENHFVLVKTPSENSKLIKIQNNATISLGKFGSFFTAQLLGKHYDTTYQVLPDKTLSRIDTSSVLSAFELDFENPAESTATNVDFVDDSSTQALSHADIETLKEESFVTGADGQIIQKLINNSKTFSKKTEFAKAKYIKNKAKKYSKIITLLPPTAKNLCEYYFEKNPEKILSIRIDTLSQLLTLANVRPSAKFMVIDEADGLIVGSILEKTGGFSKILGIHEREAHVYQVPLNMNFPDSYNDFLYKIPFNAVGEPIVSQSFDESLLPEQAVVDKKERIAKTLKKLRDADALLQPCDFNGLIIVCNSPTIPIIQKLTKYLGGSSQLVVYSPSKELLLEPYMYLLKSREFINIQLTESFLREYQIPLQGMAGTHPHMMTSASGGFLLSATRVLDTIEVGFKPPVNKDRKSGRGKKRRRY